MRVGIDSLDIQRLETIASGNMAKYFTDYEIGYCHATVNKLVRMGGIYCAKEAFLKATKLGIGNGISLKEIEVLHNEDGSPYISLSENAVSVMDRLGYKNVEVSITHTHTTSTAICILF